MAGQPLFPKNWRVEERNGRRWLVRNFSKVLTVKDLNRLPGTDLLRVEQAVRSLNERNWEIGDAITLAEDIESYELFILDLSNARPRYGNAAFAADDRTHISQFFEQAGRDALAKLRRDAKSLCSIFQLVERHGLDLHNHAVWEYKHVYGSFNRPISRTWANRLPEDILLEDNYSEGYGTAPLTWVIAKTPLSEGIIKTYELTWAWSPLEYKED